MVPNDHLLHKATRLTYKEPRLSRTDLAGPELFDVTEFHCVFKIIIKNRLPLLFAVNTFLQSNIKFETSIKEGALYEKMLFYAVVDDKFNQ